MAVNVTANWRLIRSLDPLLRQSASGRALFMSSGAAQTCRPFWGAYSVSKAALDAMVQTYAKEVQKTAVRVVAINPGRTRTAMRAQAMPGEDPLTLPHPSEIVPHLTEAGGASFPSGHAFNSAVVYIAIALAFATLSARQSVRLAVIGTAIVLSLVIAWSRVWLGVHFPSDVAAGWLGGAGWAFLAAALLQRPAEAVADSETAEKLDPTSA